jgi:hypothetical protein
MVANQKVTFTQAAAAPTCSYTVSPTTVSVPATGSTGTITVTTAGGCQWSASFNASWATITSGASGTGGASVGYSVSANSSSSTRSATLTVAGSTVTFTQAAAAPVCTYALSSTSATVGSAQTTISLTVTASTGCAWTAKSNDGFISVRSGASGTGNGTVSLDMRAGPVPDAGTSLADLAVCHSAGFRRVPGGVPRRRACRYNRGIHAATVKAGSGVCTGLHRLPYSTFDSALTRRDFASA